MVSVVFCVVLGHVAPVAGVESGGSGAAGAGVDGAGPGVFEDNGPGVHQAAVAGLAQMGVFGGTECGEGLFCPGEPILRWEAAVWLARVLVQLEAADGLAESLAPRFGDGLPESSASRFGDGLPESSASRFGDVPADAWWVPHVEFLADLGVTVGCAAEPARFCPSDSVTRAQMASFLVRAFGLALLEGDGAQFVDVDGGVHAGNIVALSVSGVTKGCAVEPARFCPYRFTTRAQMASFLFRAYTRAGGPCPSEQTAAPVGVPGPDDPPAPQPALAPLPASQPAPRPQPPASQPAPRPQPPASQPAPRPQPPPPAVSVLSAPQALEVVAGHQTLTVIWAPPDIEVEVVGYRLRWRGPGQRYSDTERWVATRDLSYEIGGLVNGTNYSVQVAAGFSGEGFGRWAEGSGVPRTVAGAPRSVGVVSGDAALAVSWVAPDDTGGARIVRYWVQWTVEGVQAGGEEAVAVRAYRIGGLSNGVSYGVRVAAVNGAGLGAWSEVVVGEPLGPPGAPGTPTVGRFDRSAVVEWSPPVADGGSGISGYKVQWRTDRQRFGSSSRQREVGDRASRYEIDGLVNGRQYWVRVLAVNPSGDGAGSEEVRVVPATTPRAPARPSAERGDQEVGVSWREPVDDGGSDVAGYVVQWSDDGFDESVGEKRVGVGVREYLIGGLVNGTPYSLRVSAVNEVGDGEASPVVSATPATTPDAPAVSADRGNMAMTASWVAPDEGGSGIESYKVQWSTDDEFDDTDPSAAVGGGVLSRRVGGLVNGTEYWVRVRAVNGVGGGPWSLSASAVPAPAASRPRSVRAVAAPGSVTVSWREPTNDGGASITGYRVQWRAGSEEYGPTRERRVAPGDRSHEIVGLVNGTEYYVRVRAVAAPDDAAAAAEAAEVSAEVSATPATTPDAPAVSADRGNMAMTASWVEPDAGGSDITGYRVQWSTDDQFEASDPQAAVGGAVLSRRIGGLVNGAEYWVRVRAVNGVGEGSWSSPASAVPATVSSGLRGVVFERGHESVRVAWRPPAVDGGSDVTGHAVQWTDAGFGQSSEERIVGAGASQYLIDGLVNGRRYWVRVRAVNGVGGGPWSLSGPVTPATVPGAPGDVMLDVHTMSLGVSWVAPGDGGSDIESYKVQWSTDDQFEASDPSAAVGGAVLSRRVGGLVNGTEHWVRVRAVNGVGGGSWSSPVSAFPAAPPSAPQNLGAASGDGAVTVSWEAPADDGGSPIIGYLVQWEGELRRRPGGDWRLPPGYDGTGLTGDATVDDDVLSHRIAGLTNGLSYLVRVQALNAGVAGRRSQIEGQPHTVPGPPTHLVVYTRPGTLLLSWEAPDDDGGADVASYLVQWKGPGEEYSETERQAEVTSPRHQITGLTSGAEYTVSVRAVNAAAAGGVVTASKIVSAQPGAPGSAGVTVRNATLEVSWAPPGTVGSSPVTEYWVLWGRYGSYDSSRCSIRRITVSADGPLRGAIGPLVNALTYGIRIVAVNNAGPGPPLELTGTPMNVPGRPEGLAAFSVDGGLLVGWDQPWDGGWPITGYRVQWKGPGQDYSETERRAEVTSSTRRYRISGLTNGTRYTVRVAAVNTNGESGISVPGSPADAPGPPGAPTARTLGRNNHTYRIRLAWDAPAAVGGSPITGYWVQWRRPWTPQYNAGAIVDAPNLTFEFGEFCHPLLSGFCVGREYLFRISAINSDGIGPPAETSGEM